MAKDKKEKPAKPDAPAKEKKPKAAKAKGGGLGELFLKKGEWIVFGGALAVGLLLLVMGVGKGAKAENPTATADKLSKDAANIHTAIARVSAKDEKDDKNEPPPLPKWVETMTSQAVVSPSEFPIAHALFDITARPDTKRDNPLVYGIEDFQIDLVRAPMKAYDIRQTANGLSIAVRVPKEKFAADPNAVAAAMKKLRGQFSRNRMAQPGGQPGAMGLPPGGGPPGGLGGLPPGGGALGGGGGLPPGGGALGGLAPGGGQPPGGGGREGGAGMRPPGGGGGSAFGFGGAGGFEQNAQRSETVIEYVSVDNLDAAIEKGKIPASTVVPIRLVVVHATLPLKKQLDEIKKALRLKDVNEAMQWGPVYDGYEVQRRQTDPRGQVGEWVPYDYEEKYDEFIYSRKRADHFDVDPNIRNSQYLPYFLRYDQNLVLPLPELVTENGGSYPDLRLESITKTITKMAEREKPIVNPTEQQKRLEKQRPSSNQRYNPQGGGTAAALGGGGGLNAPGAEGGIGMGGPGAVPPGGGVGPGGAVPPGGGFGAAMVGAGKAPGIGQPPLPGAAAQQQPIEVENLLLRFIDADVKPGFSYEYRIRVKMTNPNFGQKGLVRIPAFAEENYKTLYSPWVELPTSISVPPENFLFAYDPAVYRKTMEDQYGGRDGSRALLSRFQIKDGSQAVVQIQQWRQEVRTGDASRREPVGGWVVTEMPVDRGGYIGRKQYVKLPIWSSEADQFVLRELPDKVMKGEKQPKGWLVDFTDQSVLVDFEGGKTKATLIGGRVVEDDVGEELLILGRDGKLLVRSSVADENDPNRRLYSKVWAEWVKAAEGRKVTAGGMGGSSEFEKGGSKQ